MKKTHEKSRIHTVTGTTRLKNPENVVLQIEATGQRNSDGFIYLVEGVAVDWAPCEKCQFFKANKERGKK